VPSAQVKIREGGIG